MRLHGVACMACDSLLLAPILPTCDCWSSSS